MLSRTAARARSAQGASQFAAGYAAVRLAHHSDGRPVHIMKTSQVTVRLCLRMSRDSRVHIRPFCPRHPFISLLRVQIGPFCPRRWIHVCKITPFVPVAFHVCCPEQWQEPALLRVLRKRNSSRKASSDAGPELAGRESCVAMESPQALMCPLEKGINKSSSDDRPGPGICDSKYVEDAKAARSVRVWDRVPMKYTRLGGLR